MEELNIQHEADEDAEISAERQAEIDSIPVNKRAFRLATSSDPRHKGYSKASDGTFYKRDGNGPLKRVTKKETKKERKIRKAKVKAMGKP